MSNTAPLASVVVITYNSQKYVVETLNSIRDQSYKNIELIISDDSSNDETMAICKHWIEKERSRFINTNIITSITNSGIPENCNRGVNIAKGEWIKIIAGDDHLLPECIHNNLQFINENPHIKILYSEAEKIDDQGNALPNNTTYYRNQPHEWKLFFFTQNQKEQLKLFARAPFFLVSPTLFVKKVHLQAINGFDNNCRIYEDIPFVLKSLSHGEQIYYMDGKTVRYRIHNNSISKKKQPSIAYNNLQELKYIYKKYRLPHLKSLNIYDIGARFEAWLLNVYILKMHLKGARFLAYLNPFRHYQNRIIKLYKKTNA